MTTAVPSETMAPIAAPLRLPRIDAGAATLRSAALTALGGQRFAVPGLGEAVLVASLGAAAEADAWVTCAGGIAVSPVAADGRRLDLIADDGNPDAAAAVAALAALEPLLACAETALGLVLRPEGLAAAPAPDAVIIGVTAGSARLLIAIAPGAALRPVSPPIVVDRIGVRWRLCLPGPGLPRRPSRGDLLTGIAATGAILVSDHVLPVVLARAGHEVSVIGEWRRIMDNDSAAAGFDTAGVRLPVTVCIDGAVAAIGDLARLAPGAVLPLPGDPARLVVTVNAGGAPLATGTLVAVGDGLGVLIDQVYTVVPAAVPRAA